MDGAGFLIAAAFVSLGVSFGLVGRMIFEAVQERRALASVPEHRKVAP